MGRLLIWLSGASWDLLRRSPADRERYFGLGASVLIASCLAGTSLGISLRDVVGSPLALAILFGIAFFCVMITLNRWIVLSLYRQQSPLITLVYAIPGVALSIILGVVIAAPVTAIIFQPEIQRQITEIELHNANMETSTAADSLNKKITSERAIVASLENEIATEDVNVKNPAQDPTVESLLQQRNEAKVQAQADYNVWQCEITGEPAGACSGVAGDGPAAHADYQRYLNEVSVETTDTAQINAAEQQIENNQSAHQTTAQHSLLVAEDELLGDVKQQSQLSSTLAKANTGNSGLLLQLQALSDLSSENASVDASRWVLAALLTLILCLPLLSKVLLNLGSEST